MSDLEIQLEQVTEPTPPLPDPTVSFSVWPPTQCTRDAVINRLIENLSTPSVLSKRYGTMSPDEAVATSRQIEDEAFSAASNSASSDDDGLQILQVYSKEISKRMLDTVKASAPLTDSGAISDVASSPATEIAAVPDS